MAYQEEHKNWRARIEREESDRKRKYDAAARWYPISRLEPTRRIDVFGGEIEGWASLMHTALAPLIASAMPVTVLDLTRRDLARRALWESASEDARPPHVSLPDDLERYDPLLGARYPGDLAAVLTSTDGVNEDAARRDIETGILRRVAGTLNGYVTLPRMLAATVSMLAPDAPLVRAHLSVEERRDLTEPDFLVMLGGDAASHLGRIAAALEAVVGLSPRETVDRAAPREALPFFSGTGLVLSAGRHFPDPETLRRLDNLLAASLVDRLAYSRQPQGLLLVLGADRLSRANLEGLAAAALENRMRLAVFSEHLREAGRDRLGRGPVETIIMGLGNHEDATAAADFIGKQHRFVISSITKTVGTQLGGADTHGLAVNENWSRGRDAFTVGGGKGVSFSYSRTWAETENYGETSTRSEEYVARAEDIQRIPTTGFIYVSSVDGRQHVVAGDCHPAIARTPLVSARAISRR